MKIKYYKCEICGKVVAVIKDTPAKMECCGQPMVEIEQKESEDTILDKHLPVYERDGDKIYVRVGSMLHPTTVNHYIEWVSLLTNKGFQLKMLGSKKAPKVTFKVDKDEEVLEITSFCNIHSLYTLCPDNVEDEDDCGCTIKY